MNTQFSNSISTAEYLALKSYKAPTPTDYESAITRLVQEKVALESKLDEIRNILSLSFHEFDDVFKIALIKKALK